MKGIVPLLNSATAVPSSLESRPPSACTCTEFPRGSRTPRHAGFSTTTSDISRLVDIANNATQHLGRESQIRALSDPKPLQNRSKVFARTRPQPHESIHQGPPTTPKTLRGITTSQFRHATAGKPVNLLSQNALLRSCSEEASDFCNKNKNDFQIPTYALL